MSDTNHLTGVRKILAALAIAITTSLTMAGPATAHNYYISSTPSVDEVLTTLPDEFIVTTNDNLLDLGGSGGGFFMQVTGPDGLYYGDGCVTVTGPSVTMSPALGPPGDYTLDWQVISADGHTVSDEIPFRWQPAPGSESTGAGSATAPNCGKETGQEATNAPNSSDDAARDATSDMLWIGGAILAIAIAVITTLLFIRPRKKT